LYTVATKAPAFKRRSRFRRFRGAFFPPERVRGQFGQRPGPMRRDDFPSPIAPGDDRKGESPPDEIGPIPVDIQIGLIPAVAAMLRPDSRDLRLNAGAVVVTVYNRFWLTDH
jgi:hypothetical protein